jgi:cytochrome c
MKKAFVTLSAGILILSSVSIISCGDNKSDAEAKKDTVAAAPAPVEKDPAIAEGLELIGKSDCLTCHKINEAAIGPAYAAVAAKYAGNPNAVDSLALKVIKGGAGNWGPVAMTPHPTISEADAKKMVTYVLSIKAE